MRAPLSQDLRERIVRAVEKGSSIRQAALRFEVSPSAAVKLMRRVRESGSPLRRALAATGGPSWTSTTLSSARSSVPSPTSRSSSCKRNLPGRAS